MDAIKPNKTDKIFHNACGAVTYPHPKFLTYWILDK